MLAVLLLVAMLPLGAFSFTVNAKPSDCSLAREGYFLFEFSSYSNGWTLMRCAKTAVGEVVIPSTVQGYSVISVESEAFRGCTEITSVIMPEGVRGIYGNVFEGCTNLVAITIPSSVRHITDTFLYCNSLVEFIVSGDNPYFAAVDGVLFDKDKTKLIRYPSGKAATSYTIPKSVTSIGTNAFSGCGNLENFIITENSNFITIDNVLFSKDGTALLQYPLGKEDTTYVIPSGVITVARGAFSNSTLTSVTIPKSVTEMGWDAFAYCIDLKTVVIEDLANWCGFNFYSEWTYYGGGAEIPGFRSEVFNPLIYADNLCCDGRVITDFVIPEGVTKIAAGAFGGYKKLESIVIPSSVVSVGSHAFYDCENLESVFISDLDSWCNINFVYQYDEVFPTYVANPLVYAENLYCNNELVTIAEIRSNVAKGVFYNYKKLTGVTLSKNVTNIGDKAFYGCENLTSVYYRGSEADKSAIVIGRENSYLKDATWYYNSCIGAAEHTYSGDCDAVCNGCEVERTATAEHTYTDACDAECSVCKHIRTIEHIYDGECDGVCNVCEQERTAPHYFEWVVDKHENCGVNGEKYEECSRCHIKRNENTVIPATGNHSYEWVIDTENNCGVNGTKHEECSVCHIKRNENTMIPATGNHNYEWVVDRENNCGVNGKKHEECNVCYAKRNENTVIDATGEHIYDNIGDAICNVCDYEREVNLQYIVITNQPTKLLYTVGEEFDRTGMVVRAYYDTGDIEITDYTIIGDLSTAGTKVLVVSYGGKTASVVVVVETAQNGWISEAGKWYFYENGNMVKNAWRKDSKGWVFLGTDGAMKTNAWCTDSQGWCYVGADGYAVTNCWKRDSIGWIWLNANGSMTKNAWVQDGGKWYFLDANGYMVSNAWRKDSKGWVYLGSGGAMLTNAWCTDSKGWCYVGADGYAVTNCWKKDSAGWIWLDANGSMTKSQWLKEGNNWYYLNANGYMVTGKHWIDGRYYTFNASGVWNGK